jgi:hypothetical protein
MTGNSMRPITNHAPAQPDSAWRAPRWTLSGRVAVAASVAALIGAALAPQLSAATAARADRTISVNDVCNNYRPGYVAALAGFTLGGVRCTPPAGVGFSAIMPPDDSATGGLVAPGFPGLPPGSYRVNPFDPFSDWVIPG